MNFLQKTSSSFLLAAGLFIATGCGGLRPEYKKGYKDVDPNAQSARIVVESMKLQGGEEYLVREELYNFKANLKTTTTFRVDTSGGQNVEYDHAQATSPISNDDEAANILRNEMCAQPQMNIIP